MVAREESYAAGGGHQNGSTRVRNADNFAGGQSLSRVERIEARAVVTEQSVLRPYPQESRGILREGGSGQVRQTFGLPVHLKRIVLCQAPLDGDGQDDEMRQEPGASPLMGLHLFQFLRNRRRLPR